MGNINVDFNKYYKMVSEAKNAAAEYRKLIADMKNGVVSSLMPMKEPSLGMGISKINEVISEMEKTASALEKTAGELESHLRRLKKVQDDTTNAANGLFGRLFGKK